MTTETIDIAVIGGGPAGLTAALYAARGYAKTVVFEQGMPGGQIVTTAWVENYPGFPKGVAGSELGDYFAEQAAEFGAEIRPLTAVERLTRNEDGTFTLALPGGTETQAKAVILATGAVPRKLEIPGETQFTGRGVSWCATCDGMFYRNKVVAVIGGGNAALEESMFLTKFADTVHLVHRRDEFRADQVVVERARNNEKIEFHTSFSPVEIVGEDNKVTGLRLQSTKDGHEETIPLDGVFLFVGTLPTSALIGDMLETNKAGYVPRDSSGRTSVPGLFVAGDVSESPLKQVVTAAGEGASAGFAALAYLEEIEHA